MTKKNKALIYNLVSFGLLFITIRYVALNYTGLTGILKPLTAFVVATIIAPKFQAVKNANGEKIFMKWIFIKGFKEIE